MKAAPPSALTCDPALVGKDVVKEPLPLCDGVFDVNEELPAALLIPVTSVVACVIDTPAGMVALLGMPVMTPLASVMVV
jgi:hypothetical protein